MKKILFIIPSMTPAGGIERVVSTIANKLSLAFECTILTYDNNDSFYTISERVIQKKLDCNFKLNMGNRFIRAFQVGIKFLMVNLRLKKILKDKDYDYIYVTHPLDHLQLLISGCNIKKIVISEHGANNNYNGIYKFIRKYTYKKCYAYCVPTTADYEFYKKFGFPVKYSPHYRPQLSYKKISSDSKVVLCIGRLTPDKQHLKLLNLWKKIHEHTQNEWILKIVGNGELHDTLVAAIEENNLSSSVELHAATKDIERYYSDSSIFVLTSRSEGFGMVLLEAISFGLPVVAFDCPSGPKDIINDQNGFLVPVGSDDEFVARVISLINNDELRKNYIDKSYISSKEWDDEKITNIWMNILK